MKKIIALILTLILTFSLSAAAFAATTTNVTVTVDSTNISVTVPLSFSVGAKVDGGTATVPDDYKIANNSAIPVKVDSIAVVLNDATDWAFKDTAIDAADAAPTNSGVNDIYLTVNGQVMAVQDATAPTTPVSWNIAASSNLELPLVCSTSRLDQTTDESNLITITYVISAGSHTDN